jgi:hypothetical protein
MNSLTKEVLAQWLFEVEGTERADELKDIHTFDVIRGSQETVKSVKFRNPLNSNVLFDVGSSRPHLLEVSQMSLLFSPNEEKEIFVVIHGFISNHRRNKEKVVLYITESGQKDAV